VEGQSRTGGSLSDFAQSRLTRLILDRELAAGTPIVEEKLALSLDISRTPLREALARMEAEGLVVKAGGRSYQVRLVTAPEFFQSMRVREVLEREIVRSAAPAIPPAEIAALQARIARLVPGQGDNHLYWQADNALHSLFADHCGNPVMAGVVQDMRITARLFEASSPFGRAAADQQEHLAILQAAAAGDAAAAGLAMARHIRNLQQDVMKSLRHGQGARPGAPVGVQT
jgi:GntR family transcriptional regulator, rspAB operon transcriptional repressor